MNLSEIVARFDLAQNAHGVRMDSAAVANGTLFLERELLQIRNRVLEVKYPENKAITFVPLATDINRYVDTFSWKVTNSWGQARIINGDEKSLPRVGLDAEERTASVVSLGLSYGWTRNEMQKAMWLGQPLSDKLARATRRGHEISIDEILRTGKLASLGQTANGLTGFCNNSSVKKDFTFTAWLSRGSTPTALQIYQDLVDFTTYTSDLTKDMYSCDTLVMAGPLYKKVSTTPMFSFGETTILQYFLKNSPNIKNVAQWGRLDNAGDGTIGTSSYHQMICYQRDNEVLEGVVPVRFESIAPQISGFNTEIPCMSKCGGTLIYVPAAVNYGFVNNSTT
jgi:hypothetical protein